MQILSLYSWHKSGLITVKATDLPYKFALGLKYLIDYNEVRKIGLF